MRPGARSSYELTVAWWSDSVLLVGAPRGADVAEVRAVMDCEARAAGREVVSTYWTDVTRSADRRLTPGPYLVAWCQLVQDRAA